jgi:hypothetical protein
MADGHVAIGDDKQGKRVYHFLDSSLDRVYSSLSRKAGASDQAQLGAEYAALTRFQRYYCDAGLMGSVGSVDYNSLGTNIASGRTFLAATERQINARDEVRRAFNALSPGQRTVLEHVVIWDRSLELAGYAIGRKSKPYSRCLHGRIGKGQVMDALRNAIARAAREAVLRNETKR